MTENNDLEQLSLSELIALEDELLLEQELNLEWEMRIKTGRILLFVFAASIWGLSFILLMPIFKLKFFANNPLSIIVYFISLLVSVFLANRIWTWIGLWPRFIFRQLIHYWPILLILLFFKT